MILASADLDVTTGDQLLRRKFDMARTVTNSLWVAGVVVLLTVGLSSAQPDIVVLGGEGRHCGP